MALTEAQKRAIYRDRIKNSVNIGLSLRRTTDADLVQHFELMETRTAEIKRLLRKAIAMEKAEQEQQK